MAETSPIIIARFWSKVDVGKPTACWPWRASLDKHGYGQFKGATGTTPKRAHRIAYSLVCGDPTTDEVVRHLCGNAACCNPAHLALGDQADNHADREAHGHAPRQSGRFVKVGDGAVTGNRTLDLLITNEVLYR